MLQWKLIPLGFQDTLNMFLNEQNTKALRVFIEKKVYFFLVLRMHVWLYQKNIIVFWLNILYDSEKFSNKTIIQQNMNLLIHYMRRSASSRPSQSPPVSQTRRNSSWADINKGKDVNAQSMTSLLNIDYTTDYNCSSPDDDHHHHPDHDEQASKQESNKLKIQAQQGHGTCSFTSHQTPWSSLSSYYFYSCSYFILILHL